MTEPFSHPDYSKNADRCPPNVEPCVICGKPVRNKDAVYLIVSLSSGSFILPKDEASTPDAGGFPIGEGCLRKHRKELVPYLAKEA